MCKRRLRARLGASPLSRKARLKTLISPKEPVVWKLAWPPQRPCSSLVTVPHTFVNDKDIRADYELLRNELCADGAKSSACTYANKHQVVEAWNHEEISCEVA